MDDEDEDMDDGGDEDDDLEGDWLISPLDLEDDDDSY